MSADKTGLSDRLDQLGQREQQRDTDRQRMRVVRHGFQHPQNLYKMLSAF